MDITSIISLITIIVTYVLGILAKKSTFINNKLIPIQNIVIGLIVAIVEWIITKDFSTAIALSGLIAGGIGAGLGLVTAIYSDYAEDSKWFNGDWTDYVGKIAGGFIAGFGVGIATVLGAGVGAAILGGTTATLFTSTGLALSLSSAVGIGSATAFLTGMAGYTLRVAISRSESFKWENMLVEGGFNAISGMISVYGGYLGGLAGVHNTVFTKLLSQKGDVWLRLLVENVFTIGVKSINPFIKSYFLN